MTKYINGHSDVVGGVLISNHDEMIEKIAFLQNAMGAIIGPMDSWLVLRATKTLAISHGSTSKQMHWRLAKH
jgi:cystathionine beta-lyase/cystathionine gamma-synthase